MAYTLSGQKLLLSGRRADPHCWGAGELHEKCVGPNPLTSLSRLCHRLVDYDGNLDFQLETWLMAIGKQKEIEKWRASMNE